MAFKLVQLRLRRCAGRAAMADLPHGQGRTPTIEVHGGAPQSIPKRVPCFHTASWGVTKTKSL
eukprot:14542592-Alexandrium_andersonii.AAC.1